MLDESDSDDAHKRACVDGARVASRLQRGPPTHGNHGASNRLEGNHPVKKLLLASVASVALASGALAADLPVRAAPPPPPVYAFNWTGFYIGAQIGYQMNQGDFAVGAPPAPPFLVGGYDADGVIGGIHLGYNWQTGSLVLGVEGDIELSGASGTGASVPAGFIGGSDLNWQGSLRLRAGFAIDRLLLYVTGGIAFGDFDHTFAPAVGIPVASFSDTRIGWTVGAGAEWAFAPNWSARIEYRYTDYGSASGSAVPLFGPPVIQEHDIQSHAIRVGITYRFGGPAPAPAVVKY